MLVSHEERRAVRSSEGVFKVECLISENMKIETSSIRKDLILFLLTLFPKFQVRKIWKKSLSNREFVILNAKRVKCILMNNST